MIDAQWGNVRCGKDVVGHATRSIPAIDAIACSVPSGDTEPTRCGGAFTRSGNDYPIVAPSRVENAPGGSCSDTGLCILRSGSGQLSSIVVASRRVAPERHHVGPDADTHTDARAHPGPGTWHGNAVGHGRG